MKIDSRISVYADKRDIDKVRVRDFSSSSHHNTVGSCFIGELYCLLSLEKLKCEVKPNVLCRQLLIKAPSKHGFVWGGYYAYKKNCCIHPRLALNAMPAMLAMMRFHVCF